VGIMAEICQTLIVSTSGPCSLRTKCNPPDDVIAHLHKSPTLFRMVALRFESDYTNTSNRFLKNGCREKKKRKKMIAGIYGGPTLAGRSWSIVHLVEQKHVFLLVLIAVDHLDGWLGA